MILTNYMCGLTKCLTRKTLQVRLKWYALSDCAIFLDAPVLCASHSFPRCVLRQDVDDAHDAFTSFAKQPPSTRKFLFAVLIFLAQYITFEASARAEVAMHASAVATNTFFARAGRVQVATRFLTGGNRHGVSYVQYLFEEASDFEFRRELRVSRRTFATLEQRLTPLLNPKAGSFRKDALSAREKIALSLHYMGSRGIFFLN